MNMRPLTSLVLCIALGALVPTAASQHSSVLSGTVVTDEATPQPIGRVIVTLAGTGLPRASSVISDNAGRFVFRGLPAGRFTLTATKPAYTPGAFGATRPGRPGTPVTLAPGQQLGGVTIALSRAAVITGTVRDTEGQPAPGLPVVAIRTDQPGSSPMVSALESEFVTDDRGVYRIFGLLPGDYIVAASFGGPGSSEVTLPSAAENEAALRQLAAARGNSGGFLASTPSPDRPSPRYVRGGAIFFPGTSAPGEAAKISLKAGDERVADFSVRFVGFVRAASVSGAVTGPAGAAEAVTMSLVAEGPEVPGLFAGAPSLIQRPGADGRFRFSGVQPGRYVLNARTTVPGTRGGGDAGARGGGGGGAGRAAPAGAAGSANLWARAELEVTGDDIEDVALTLQPGMRLRGSVAFDTATLTPPVNLTAIQVLLSAPAMRNPVTGISAPQIGIAYVPPASVRADGTFEVTGITPGTYRVASTLTGGWWLRSAVVNGQDILDRLVQFGNGGDIAGAVLTFTDKHSEIAGALQTSAGDAATDYFVVAFSADRAMWRPGSRRMQSTRPATDGHYSFKDLPTGEYLVVALTDFEPRDLDDPGFLESIAPSALTVTLGEGERKVQDLRLAR
jgi:hypothetical protein